VITGPGNLYTAISNHHYRNYDDNHICHHK